MNTSSTPGLYVPPGAGHTLRVISDLVTFKALASTTNGAYSLFETRTPPQGGTPPHMQPGEEEAFFVLEGTYAFQLGDQRLECGPGGFAFVPRGTVHAFTNTGPAPARMLILVSPGGNHEQFFAALGEDPSVPMEGPPDVEKIVRIAHTYGIEILPPPGN
jgi:quercetin dioxygenase-like cupin family protein